MGGKIVDKAFDVFGFNPLDPIDLFGGYQQYDAQKTYEKDLADANYALDNPNLTTPDTVQVVDNVATPTLQITPAAKSSNTNTNSPELKYGGLQI